MNRVSVTSLGQLHEQIFSGAGWTNGKNFPVDHLHATVAQSRWAYENIHGIYVANETHDWMAVWMAVSKRETLRKRQLRYIAPTAAHILGGLEVFTSIDISNCLNNRGYLYSFQPDDYLETGQAVDISEVPKPEKTGALLQSGFEWSEIERRGEQRKALVDTTGEPRIVRVDEWQIALTNRNRILPETEIIIEESAIRQLLGYVALSSAEVGEDYIVR